MKSQKQQCHRHYRISCTQLQHLFSHCFQEKFLLTQFYMLLHFMFILVITHNADNWYRLEYIIMCVIYYEM